DEERDVQLAAVRAFGRLCTQGPTPRPPIRDALELVTRSGDSDLIAVLVRAVGEGAGASDPPVSASELIAAVGALAAEPTSPIAMAAVDALGRMPTDSPGRQGALVKAADHADAAVVRAALLKLSANAAGLEEVARRLDHASAEVRILAAEILGSPSQF